MRMYHHDDQHLTPSSGHLIVSLPTAACHQCIEIHWPVSDDGGATEVIL